MRLALIGYGKMGHAVEALALEQGHEVSLRLDAGQAWPERLEADVAVEFSTPTAAADNVAACLRRGIPVVCGTTGWYDRYDELCDLCRHHDGRMLTATNFSLGMNIMFLANEYLASLMKEAHYSVGIDETHHIHKLDAPSGTAITLQQQIVACGNRPPDTVPIASHRVGEVPGTHTVRYDSPDDSITLTHEAHSRRGLARGAVMAAVWLAAAKPGVYTMRDMLR